MTNDSTGILIKLRSFLAMLGIAPSAPTAKKSEPLVFRIDTGAGTVTWRD